MSLWRAFLAQLYRERCASCGIWSPGPLCAACEAAWPGLAPVRCKTCASPLADAESACRPCRERPPAYAAAIAAGAYEGTARDALHAFKFKGRRALAPDLAARLDAVMPPGDWLVVPVPLARDRLRQRGYNQSALLARALAKRRRLRCKEVLERLGGGVPQHFLDRRARLDRLAGAFRCRRALDGARILLVDDVLTTGATAHWAAAALLEAGAAEVTVAVVARTMPPAWRR